MIVELLTEHHLRVSKLNRGLQWPDRVYTCQNVKLLEISCRGSHFSTISLKLYMINKEYVAICASCPRWVSCVCYQYDGFVSFNLPQSTKNWKSTVLPPKSDSDAMFCLQSYHGLIIDRSLVY